MKYQPPIIESDGTRRQGKRVRPDDWYPSFGERELSFIRIDHQTWLNFGDVAIVIACPFTLNVSDETHLLDERKNLGPLLAQFPDTLTTTTVGQDGTLHLAFSRGWTIDVPPDRHYEAWQIKGPGNDLVVCPPDGGVLSVWTDAAGTI